MARRTRATATLLLALVASTSAHLDQMPRRHAVAEPRAAVEHVHRRSFVAPRQLPGIDLPGVISGGGGDASTTSVAPVDGGVGEGSTTTSTTTPVAVVTTTTTTQAPIAVTTTTPAAVSTTIAPPVASTTAAVRSTLAEASSKASSVMLVTITSVVTQPDGSMQTQTSLSSSSLPDAGNTGKNASSSSSGKTWGIVGGVVGGIILLVGLGFIIYRMTQRRFSDLDDSGLDEIKWPELQPDGSNPAAGTLNPMGTRRTGGAGVGDDDDDDEGMHGYEKAYAKGSVVGLDTVRSDGGRAGWRQSELRENGSPWNGSTEWDGASAEKAGMMGLGPQGQRGSYYDGHMGSSAEHLGVYSNASGPPSNRDSYYDPYLGPSAAPYPAPPTLAAVPRSDSPSYSDHPYPPLPVKQYGTSPHQSPPLRPQSQAWELGH